MRHIMWGLSPLPKFPWQSLSLPLRIEQVFPSLPILLSIYIIQTGTMRYPQGDRNPTGNCVWRRRERESLLPTYYKISKCIAEKISICGQFYIQHIDSTGKAGICLYISLSPPWPWPSEFCVCARKHNRCYSMQTAFSSGTKMQLYPFYF